MLIIALIPLRTFCLPKWFTEQELFVLDALTADNPAVLVSFGGTPSGMKKSRGEGNDHESAVRERAGSIPR